MIVSSTINCVHLYSLSDRDQVYTVFIRVDKDRAGGYWSALSTYSGLDRTTFDIPGDHGPCESPEKACALLIPAAKEWFTERGLRYVYGDAETARIARRLAP